MGHTVTYPSFFFGTTATFSEYAPALDGMPQALFGTTKLRDVAAATDGPPKEPAAFRVSATRQGVTGVNCIAFEITGGAFGVTVSVTAMDWGLLPAPAEVMTMVPSFAPVGSPAGLMETVIAAAVSESVIHGVVVVAA